MIKKIVTDIEGTTSSLSFVKDVLFPYARKRMARFVADNADHPVVAEQLDSVRTITKLQNPNNKQLADQLIRWIDEDKKITPLKTLQGLIWEAGYNQQDFYGHIYKDAVEALKAWHIDSYELYVYSSGSVYAQKLLFAHTEYGDLTGLFSGYFDTHIGGKREAVSYTRIAGQLQSDTNSILFLSDVVEELDAANEAGFKCIQLARPGEANPPGKHPVVDSFAAINLKEY